MRAAFIIAAALLVSGPVGAKRLNQVECLVWAAAIEGVQGERDYGVSREKYRAFQEHKIEIGLDRGYFTKDDADRAREWAERAYEAGPGVDVTGEFLTHCLALARGHDA